MSTNLAAPPQPTDEFAPLFARLKSLVRNHLLQFRVEVGRVILDDFFEGDLSVYGDRSHDKQKKFSAFLAANQAALEELGLKPHLLRECVHVQIVYRTLPPAVRDQLGYSHTLALTKVGDPTMRARLANEAVAKHLTIGVFQDTVDAANAGNWYDTDAAIPGVQPKSAPAKDPPSPKPQAGRMVKQAERWVADTAGFTKDWAGIDAAKVKPTQKARLKAAIAGLRAELAVLEKKLGA